MRMYKALKLCKFDRKYGVGEVIPDGVADLECLNRAIAFGYVQEVEDAGKAEEPSEEAQDKGEEVKPEEPKRKGRKKAVS